MKKLSRSIGKILDWLACIVPNMIKIFDPYDDYWDMDCVPTNPIIYGISVLGGLIVCACAAVGLLFICGTIVCIIMYHPIASCSIVVVLGIFVGIGFLRKTIGRKSNDSK